MAPSDVEAAARETALAHLDLCDRCASDFEEQRALTVGIRVATESLANQGASPRVEVALRRAFREQVGRSAPRKNQPSAARELALVAAGNWRGGDSFTRIPGGNGLAEIAAREAETGGDQSYRHASHFRSRRGTGEAGAGRGKKRSKSKDCG